MLNSGLERTVALVFGVGYYSHSVCSDAASTRADLAQSSVDRCEISMHESVQQSPASGIRNARPLLPLAATFSRSAKSVGLKVSSPTSIVQDRPTRIRSLRTIGQLGGRLPLSVCCGGTSRRHEYKHLSNSCTSRGRPPDHQTTSSFPAQETSLQHVFRRKWTH